MPQGLFFPLYIAIASFDLVLAKLSLYEIRFEIPALRPKSLQISQFDTNRYKEPNSTQSATTNQ